MKNWLHVVLAAWICSSSLVFAEELPATVRFLNVVSSDAAPSVEIEGFPKVELVMCRKIGPIGLAPGEYQITFILANKKHQRSVQLEAGRGMLFIVAPKADDASGMQVMEYQAIHSDDLADTGKARLVRIINLTLGRIEVKTPEAAHELKSGYGHVFATKESQFPLKVGDGVVASVDLRDLSACSVVFYMNAESKLEALILPEPIASIEDDAP